MDKDHLSLRVTKKQMAFIGPRPARCSSAGGGGGKSYGQLIDALLYALRYPASKQLILRRTLPELEKSLIRPLSPSTPLPLYLPRSEPHRPVCKRVDHRLRLLRRAGGYVPLPVGEL
jgi:hypothetical protein